MFRCAFCKREFPTSAKGDAARALHEQTHVHPEIPEGADTGHRIMPKPNLEWHDAHDGEERS